MFGDKSRRLHDDTSEPQFPMQLPPKTKQRFGGCPASELIIAYMGLSENVGYIPNEIAIFHRDNDQQNHWVQWGTLHFQTNPYK